MFTQKRKVMSLWEILKTRALVERISLDHRNPPVWARSRAVRQRCTSSSQLFSKNGVQPGFSRCLYSRGSVKPFETLEIAD